eukprot:g17157.t1
MKLPDSAAAKKGASVPAKGGEPQADETVAREFWLRGKFFHSRDKLPTLTYGTAGFRSKAENLDACMYRMGALAVLRSIQTGKATGVMITASHNPVQDNGVKLVDPTGDMLEERFEKIATDLANASDDEVHFKLAQIAKDEGIKIDLTTSASGGGASGGAFAGTGAGASASVGVMQTGALLKVLPGAVSSSSSRITTTSGAGAKANGDGSGLVFVACDTRPSSAKLALAALEGIASVGGSGRYVGECSTPQLHFYVRSFNSPAYGVPDSNGYLSKLSSAWNAFLSLDAATSSIEKIGFPLAQDEYMPRLFVDAANGVGAGVVRLFTLSQMKSEAVYDEVDGGMIGLIGDFGSTLNNLDITLLNAGDGVLNSGCGADFVKTKQTPSANTKEDGRYAAFDGDADRLIYYGWRNGKFSLLDGDRIATLFAKFIGGKLQILSDEGKAAYPDLAQKIQGLNVGLVQTGYANGASVAYGQRVLVPTKEGPPSAPVIAKTGVKFCHAKAKYMDVGIYFEANGHGTIVFSQKFVDVLEAVKARSKGVSEPVFLAASLLLTFRDLINEAVGDAFSDMLGVEAILRHYGWSEQDWFDQYVDLPNRLAKVSVPDRTVLQTEADDETVCVAPEGLQAAIDGALGKVAKGRAFVRPSGTEDVIRVYAEAATEKEADKLLAEVSELVRKFCG